MKDIAQRVGIKALFIYEYYSSKKELFHEVVSFCFREHQKIMQIVFENLKYPVDIDELFKVYNTVVLFIMRNKSKYQFFFRCIIFPPEQFSIVINDKLNEVLEDSGKIIGVIYDDLINNQIPNLVIKETLYFGFIE